MNRLCYQQPLNQAKSVVLLHGWGIGGYVWEDLALALRQDHKVTQIDLPGYGLDQYQNFPTSLFHAAKKLLSQIPDDSILIGWSLGGIIATYIAYHYPQKVAQLILVASNPYFIQEEKWSGMRNEVLGKFYFSLNQEYEKTLQRFIQLQFLGCENAKFLNKNLYNKIVKYPKPSTQTLLAGLEVLKNSDVRNEFKSLLCPILAIFGRLDSLVPVAAVEQIKNLNNNAKTIIIDKASHAPFLSHDDLFLKHVQDFIG